MVRVPEVPGGPGRPDGWVDQYLDSTPTKDKELNLVAFGRIPVTLALATKKNNLFEKSSHSKGVIGNTKAGI